LKKYLIVSPGYPSITDKYSNVFVHTRVKHYISAGLDIDVFSVNRKLFAKRQNGIKYKYDSVTVEQGNAYELGEKIKKSRYDKILVHFGIRKILSSIVKAAPKTPLIIWFHGVDIIAWYRRLYNLRFKNIIKFAGYALLNTLQRFYLKGLIKTHGSRMHCVFVSNWLKQTAQKDIHSTRKIKNYSIIPNIVDENVFEYKQKSKDDRLKILSIRSFNSRNYANDLTVKAIEHLSEKPFFHELSFTICGEGRLWRRIVEPLRKYSNVKLENRFFSHEEIVKLHRQHGIMLMPSRQDTHGISTCEGMSSGLVPISSNNSAIPEYVPMSCGYLADDYIGLANAIEDLYHNPAKFLEYTKMASEFILQKCAGAVVIKEEIKIITK